jgi:hypothetical protein
METAPGVFFDKFAADSCRNDTRNKDDKGDDNIPDKIQQYAGMAFPKGQKIYSHDE